MTNTPSGWPEKLDLNFDRNKKIEGLGKLSMPEMVCWNQAIDACLQSHNAYVERVRGELSEEKILEELNKGPNYDDEISDEFWERMAKAINEGDKDFFTEVMRANVRISRKENSTAINRLITEALEEGER